MMTMGYALIASDIYILAVAHIVLCIQLEHHAHHNMRALDLGEGAALHMSQADLLFEKEQDFVLEEANTSATSTSSKQELYITETG